MKAFILTYSVLQLFNYSITYGDDVYLKNGFVWRNVQVMDTINNQINIRRDSSFLRINALDILKIDYKDIALQQKSLYELFSNELQDTYLKNKMKQEVESRIIVADSVRNEIRKTNSWIYSIYFAAGWGVPQGFRFELGYSGPLSLAFAFGLKDNWSRDPDQGTFALIGSFRMPNQLLPFTPFVLIGFGGTITLFGGPDTYALFNLGTLHELVSGIHLRPEIGFALTSKHISGGNGVFGRETPEVKEDKWKFCFNLSLEIDWANLHSK